MGVWRGIFYPSVAVFFVHFSGAIILRKNIGVSHLGMGKYPAPPSDMMRRTLLSPL